MNLLWTSAGLRKVWQASTGLNLHFEVSRPCDHLLVPSPPRVLGPPERKRSFGSGGYISKGTKKGNSKLISKEQTILSSRVGLNECLQGQISNSKRKRTGAKQFPVVDTDPFFPPARLFMPLK